MKGGFQKIASVCAVAALSVFFAAPAAASDSYPKRSIRLIVATPPGGATDLTSRLVAEKMSEYLGQSVVVENRPGGDTLVGTRSVKEAPADGYTILAQSLGFITVPLMKKNAGYKLSDFTGIGFMTRLPFIMVAGGGQPYSTPGEYIVQAKKGKLSFASGGTASAPHISAVLFLRAAGLNDVVHIPYKGNGEALTDVAAGRVSMLFDGYIGSAPFIKSGKFKALAVTSAQRMAPLPDVPTFKELGFDYTYNTWLGLLARAETPPEVINRLSEALKFALSSPELAKRFRSEGADASFVTPQEFNESIAEEAKLMEKVMADLNLQQD